MSSLLCHYLRKSLAGDIHIRPEANATLLSRYPLTIWMWVNLCLLVSTVSWDLTKKKVPEMHWYHRYIHTLHTDIIPCLGRVFLKDLSTNGTMISPDKFSNQKGHPPGEQSRYVCATFVTIDLEGITRRCRKNVDMELKNNTVIMLGLNAKYPRSRKSIIPYFLLLWVDRIMPTPCISSYRCAMCVFPPSWTFNHRRACLVPTTSDPGAPKIWGATG